MWYNLIKYDTYLTPINYIRCIYDIYKINYSPNYASNFKIPWILMLLERKHDAVFLYLMLKWQIKMPKTCKMMHTWYKQTYNDERFMTLMQKTYPQWKCDARLTQFFNFVTLHDDGVTHLVSARCKLYNSKLWKNNTKHILPLHQNLHCKIWYFLHKKKTLTCDAKYDTATLYCNSVLQESYYCNGYPIATRSH